MVSKGNLAIGLLVIVALAIIFFILIGPAGASTPTSTLAGLPTEAYDNCQEEVQPTLWMDLGCVDGTSRRIFHCYDDGGTEHLWGQINACGQPQCDAGFTAPSGCVLCHTLSEYGERTFLPFTSQSHTIIGEPIP
jgi:hypothetical protein